MRDGEMEGRNGRIGGREDGGIGGFGRMGGI